MLESGRRAFRADVEGLRAVAVGLVLLDHLLRRPAGGFVGVDVFFVISGFLITGLLLKEGDRTSRISLREFYARRARRIVPAAVLVLLSTAAVGRYVFPASRAHDTAVDALWAFGFLANHHFSAIGTDYFEQTRPPSPVQHYWSLSVEEQFYVVWPLLLMLAYALLRRSTRLSRRALVLGLALTVSAGSFGVDLLQTASSPTAAYFSTASRGWELGVGAVVAALGPRLLRLPAAVRVLLSWAGLAGIGAAALLFSAETTYPGSAAVLPVVSTGLLLASCDVPGGVGTRWALGSGPARYLGRVSYSLYLWHWPCIVLGAAWFGDGTPEYYVCGGALALLLAVACHHLVEEPVRQSDWLSRKPAGHWRRTPAEWVSDHERSVASLAVGAAVVLAWATVAQPQVPSADAGGAIVNAVSTSTAARVPDSLDRRVLASVGVDHWGRLTPSLDDLPSALAPEWLPGKCLDVDQKNVARCSYGKAGAARTAVLVGDSFAISYLPGIRAALEPRGWRIQSLTLNSCPPVMLATSKTDRLDRKPYDLCLQHRSWVLDQLRQLRPDLVVAADAPVEVDKIVGGGPSGDPANYVKWQQGWNTTLSTFKPLTKRMVVLGSPPGSRNLQTCVTRGSSPDDCARPLDDRWRDVRRAEAAAAAATGAVYVDPLTWFCAADLCPAVIGSTPVYWDGDHLTAAYSRSLGPLLAPYLLG